MIKLTREDLVSVGLTPRVRVGDVFESNLLDQHAATYRVTQVGDKGIEVERVGRSWSFATYPTAPRATPTKPPVPAVGFDAEAPNREASPSI
ncbi:MAG TPA: hypothetical protein VF316_16430 [Polyangiaceae bacterium]